MSTASPLPPPPRNGNGSVVGRLLAIFAAISTWKQASITLLLGAAIFVGVLVYQHPGWVEPYVTPEREITVVPVLQLQAELPALRKQLDATIVVVLAASPERNEARLLAVTSAPELALQVEQWATARGQSSIPLLPAENPVWGALLSRVLDGEVACISGDQPDVPLLVLAQVIEVCAVGIPPGPDALVGVVKAGWTTVLDRGQRTRARSTLRAAALRWTVRP